MSDNAMFVWLNFFHYISSLFLIFAPVYLAINFSYWWLFLILFIFASEAPSQTTRIINNSNKENDK